MSSTPRVVASNIDSWWLNVILLGFPPELAQQLEELKQLAQEAEDDAQTPFTFAGETLFIKPHSSQRQWRWILHCPSLHLDLGMGKRNHIVCKSRLSATYLWEVGPEKALAALYAFLADFFGAQAFTLQVSEVHLCADIAGWDPSVEDSVAFITRGHNKQGHVLGENGEEETTDAPAFSFNLTGRVCTGFEFSKGAAHSCCIYDKTKELAKSRKDWMRAVWERNGWDGEGRVMRVEFRYKRECLRELGIEGPYEMLDKLTGMWAYSSAQWLRHTIPTDDSNRGRWETSPFWQAVQAADCFHEGEPLVRERKRQGDVNLLCQMIAGCSTTVAAYLEEKRATFRDIRNGKRLRLGVVPIEGVA